MVPAKPIFNKRYVGDTYIRRKKNFNDKLFQNLNSYHKNIQLTLEENPRKFLAKLFKIATDFDKELRKIKKNLCKLVILLNLSMTLFFRFNEEKEELLIPKWFFDETKSSY